jgi:hypothetical protein
MLIDCPHCYTRVVPKVDGTCPACQKDTNDLAGADLSRTSIRVGQGDVLPSVCCDCGYQTQRRVRVYRNNQGDKGELRTGIGALILAALG